MIGPCLRLQHRAVAVRRCSSVFVSLIAWLGMIAIAVAAPGETESPEYAVKAAFLFKFGAYVEWPADTFATDKTPLVIGIVGDDPFGSTLDNVVAGHAIDGRPVEIIRSQQIGQISNEQILFISLSEKERMAKIAANLERKKVLTVAEFDDPNIMIQFVTENNKVRFDINLDQANRVGIKISSKLLNVARNVKRK